MNSDTYKNLITEATSDPKCDFCYRKMVTWRYKANDFVVPAVKYVSRGDWAACDTCAEYIESDKLDDLAFLISGLRVLSNPEIKAMAGSDQEAYHIVLYHWTREFYRAFAKSRTGERVKA